MDYDDCWTESGHDHFNLQPAYKKLIKTSSNVPNLQTYSIQDTQNIVRWCLKARITELEETSIRRQWLGKHIPTATMLETITNGAILMMWNRCGGGGGGGGSGGAAAAANAITPNATVHLYYPS
jgi:hypothetical protein